MSVARAVVQADLSIDAQYDVINARVLETLSRFQPVARDIRDVLAIENIALFLERIADHAKKYFQARDSNGRTNCTRSKRKAGVWDRIMDAITAAYDGKVQMIDTSCVRVHQHAGSAKKGVEIVVWGVREAG